MANPYKQEFISTCLEAQILRFGNFTLKSGRQSPYFFNAGLFHSASLLRSLSGAYAGALSETNWKFDVLFGPAYKGIPLAAVTCQRLAEVDEARFGQVGFAFNRKEVKDHGEGGRIVGSEMRGKGVVIVDDVITAGTAVREAMEVIRREGGRVVGVLVAFDRMEKTPSARELDARKEGRSVPDAWEEGGGLSAIGEVEASEGIEVKAILTLDDVLENLRSLGSEDDIKRLEEYSHRYRATG